MTLRIFALMWIVALTACSGLGSMGGGGALPAQSDSGQGPSGSSDDSASDETPSGDEPDASESPATPEGTSAAAARQPAARTSESAAIAAPYQLQGRPVAPATSPNAVRALCAKPTRPRQMQCLALMRVDIAPVSEALLAASHYLPQGYGPKDFENAYNLPSTRGSGQTVAIVDAFYDPQAASDLAVYRKTYGLPACTIANRCLRIVNQQGTTLPHPRKSPADDNWAGEQSLDLDTVSAICPRCHILLVEANNDDGKNLDAGVNTAVALGAKIVSNSYGGNEYAASDPAFVHQGVVIVASAGDSGAGQPPARGNGPMVAGAEQPCSFATVVCAGGTDLQQASRTPRGWTERVWNDGSGATGSGCSVLVPKPSWQTDRGCTKRSETDIAANADPDNSPIAVYYGGWTLFGGTSESSPLIAAVFALAGNAASTGAPASLWRKGSSGAFFDVTQGNNEGHGAWKCPSSMHYICYAGTGYDGPSGWGTPNGITGF